MTTYARQFSRSALSVGKARDFVAALAGIADRADDIRLCVSELATNALVYGTPRGREFRVHVTVEDDAVRVEVHDASAAPPHLRHPDAMDDYGRGLHLVDALADDWGTADRTGPGKVIWALFKLPCTAPPEAASRQPNPRLCTVHAGAGGAPLSVGTGCRTVSKDHTEQEKSAA
jgi:anti-sigma regulatory factor (Ser/Thr protein kinase)